MATAAASVVEELLNISAGAKGRRRPHRGDDYEMDLVAAVQQGLPAQSVWSVADRVGLPTSVLYSVVPRRTFERRRSAGALLTTDESDRLLRVIRVMERAIETFGDRTVAIEWMGSPNRAMGGRTPLSVVNTDPGVAIVQRILGRIEHGVFS